MLGKEVDAVAATLGGIIRRRCLGTPAFSNQANDGDSNCSHPPATGNIRNEYIEAELGSSQRTAGGVPSDGCDIMRKHMQIRDMQGPKKGLLPAARAGNECPRLGTPTSTRARTWYLAATTARTGRVN